VSPNKFDFSVYNDQMQAAYCDHNRLDELAHSAVASSFYPTFPAPAIATEPAD
jgi:hypothetical protein